MYSIHKEREFAVTEKIKRNVKKVDLSMTDTRIY